jgi:Protein of unknown function (DUF1592)/Protein of unknown function (DUF1588)/Protein of unknown function (DUF1595)/Protein of unknown function (DUF1587)/Protein of unknown function (DUF1585)
MRAPLATLLSWGLLLACTGDLEGQMGAGADGTPSPPVSAGGSTPSATNPAGGSVAESAAAPIALDAVSSAPTATPTLTRLSVLQWANTVRDLLPLANPGDLDSALTKDAVVRFDNEADSLFVGQDLHNDLQSEAERLAGLVVADPAALARLVPAAAPADLAGKAEAYLRDFGRRAYRRPLTSEELQDYVALFQQGPTLTTGLEPFAAGVRVTLEVFLQSVPFLYRSSFGGAAVAGRARLTDHEIAANLAYALTDHPPDADLAAAADRGVLGSTEAIANQARRLLPSTAGRAAVDRFFFQYFGLGQYDTLQKDPAIAPQFTDATGPLLHEEGKRLLQYLFSENLGMGAIFTTSVSFVNAPLAKLYGLPGTFSDDIWTQVSFNVDERPGLLTRLGFVAYFGYQDRPNSIKRGANLNSRILCNELSPPPNIVLPALPEPDPNRTNREQIAGLTEGCGASCHVPFINPAGFAFENFDGLGNYRATENGKPIDASGTYFFKDGPKEFADVVEFNQALAESSQAHACYTLKWASNLFARLPRKGDEELASRLAQRSIDQQLSSKELVIALISDDAFVTRVEGPQ